MFDCKLTASRRLLPAALFAVIFNLAAAQTAEPTPASTPKFATSTKPALSAVKSAAATGGPSWAELTAAQKAALAPLAGSWPVTVEEQKRKWLEISKNYPRLSPAEQTTMHSRMNEWVALSPQQRAEARLNFAKAREVSAQLTPDEKKAKWETYQALSPEEKKGLAAAAVPKPAGAATAVKPVAPQKLVVVPKNPAPPASAVSAQIPAPAAAALPAVIKP